MAGRILQLDYQLNARRGGWIGLIFIVMGLTSTVVVSMQYGAIQERITTLSDQLDRASSRDESDSNHDMAIERATAGAVASTNAVIAQLSTPWNTLFKSLEVTRGSTIALLAIEPDTKTRTVRILGETERIRNISPYLKRLQKQKVFSDVILTEHEIVVIDTQSHVRFTVTASWKNTQ